MGKVTLSVPPVKFSMPEGDGSFTRLKGAIHPPALESVEQLSGIGGAWQV